MVVPLRIGGGTRLKIVEALALATPVVSTTIGAEGLGLERGKHLALADEPESFAAAVCDLFDAPGKGVAMGRRGRIRSKIISTISPSTSCTMSTPGISRSSATAASPDAAPR